MKIKVCSQALQSYIFLRLCKVKCTKDQGTFSCFLPYFCVIAIEFLWFHDVKGKDIVMSRDLNFWWKVFGSILLSSPKQIK